MKHILAAFLCLLGARAFAVPLAPVERDGGAPQVWMSEAEETEDAEPLVDDEDAECDADSECDLTDEQADALDFEKWVWGVASERPDLFIDTVAATDRAKVVIEVNKSTQRGRIWYNGKVLVGSFKLSTGLTGVTPSGAFKPGARKVNWLSQYASRKYGRPIYLKHAVQIKGGSFMHAASSGAMNYLGQRRSGGCVRVPPQIAAKVYHLVEKNPGQAVFKVK